MYDVQTVEIEQGLHDLLEDRLGVVLAEVLARQDDVEELIAGEVLHHHHQVVGVLIHFNELDDIGMAQPPHDVHFTPQSRRIKALAKLQRPQVDNLRSHAAWNSNYGQRSQRICD